MHIIEDCMAKVIRILLSLSFLLVCATEGVASLADEELAVIRHRGQNDVTLSGNSIWMPLNRILLVRKGQEVGAVKFIRDWFWFTDRIRRAEYESYIWKDSTDRISSENIIKKKETASAIFVISRIYFGNKEVRCGSIRLFWNGGRNVHFYAEEQRDGNYGIELAPTPWTDISQVSLSDPRIKWYQYDGKRKRVNIPIDSLWGHEERGK